MWDLFPCPKCHKLLRVHRNYPLRIFRLFALAVRFWFLFVGIATSMGQHVHLGLQLMIPLTGAGAVDEASLRLFPARLEPAAAGGIGVA